MTNQSHKHHRKHYKLFKHDLIIISTTVLLFSLVLLTYTQIKRSFPEVESKSTTVKTSKVKMPNKTNLKNKGAAQIVLSFLYRTELDFNTRNEKREEVIKLLSEAGVKYGREIIEWNVLTNYECYPKNKDWTNANWADYDAVFDLYEKYDIEPVVYIMATPRNCSTAPKNATNWEKVSSPPIGCREKDIDETEPKEVQHRCEKWGSFVREVTKRYGYGPGGKQQIRYWEIWNEPDLKRTDVELTTSNMKSYGVTRSDYWNTPGYFWKGTVNDYERLIRVASNEIKTNDPSAKVLLGGITDRITNEKSFESEWFRQYLNLSLNIRDYKDKHYDIFNYHDYSNQTPQNVQYIKENYFKEYGLDDPIWITELARHGYSRDKLANEILPNKVQNVYPAGVDLFFWFMATDWCKEHKMETDTSLSSNGLLDCNIEPTPLYYSYQKYYK